MEEFNLKNELIDLLAKVSVREPAGRMLNGVEHPARTKTSLIDRLCVAWTDRFGDGPTEVLCAGLGIFANEPNRNEVPARIFQLSLLVKLKTSLQATRAVLSDPLLDSAENVADQNDLISLGFEFTPAIRNEFSITISGINVTSIIFLPNVILPVVKHAIRTIVRNFAGQNKNLILISSPIKDNAPEPKKSNWYREFCNYFSVVDDSQPAVCYDYPDFSNFVIYRFNPLGIA